MSQTHEREMLDLAEKLWQADVVPSAASTALCEQVRAAIAAGHFTREEFNVAYQRVQNSIAKPTA